MALINKNNLNKFHSDNKLYLIKNPKLSDLKSGDFVITVEALSNVYFVTNESDIPWIHSGYKHDSIIVQVDSNNFHAHLPLNDYSENLKWQRPGSSRDYSIIYVFSTKFNKNDFKTKSEFRKAMVDTIYDITEKYPEIAKSIRM